MRKPARLTALMQKGGEQKLTALCHFIGVSAQAVFTSEG